ncbi:DUF6252 family protein [Paracnuella aquatica]|uniref:DUF6252 family protein n=1 Tax=Paracnuella aquatica TaxID=2268757 RepID=UPI000DEF084F|nr:DUF6252 family protein [Paracnuella aquatica]RPD45603.1 hypothetical protein DRJ53_15490 [Paracnuella aquatica]
MKPYLILFLLTLLSTTCKKENAKAPQLPPATQEGKRVFACKVNGKVWISKGGIREMNGGIDGDTLSARGTIDTDDGRIESFGIVLLGSYRDGETEYELNDTASAYAVYRRNPGADCFSTDGRGYGSVVRVKITGGHLTVTRADRVNNIVSGTFRFNVPTDYCDTIKVTEGRFDIKTW